MSEHEKIEELLRLVLERLKQIEYQISSDGPIFHLLVTEIDQQLGDLRARVEKCTHATGDARTIDAVITSVEQIKTKLGLS